MELTHHAYYVEGLQSDFDALKAELKPFWSKQFDKFGIEDSRELVRLASLKNFDAALFLLGVPSTTSEAQQALLKLFEEPQRNTTFVVLVPHGTLLPTVMSRMQKLPELRGVRQNSLASPGRPGRAGRDEETRGLFDGHLAAEFLKAKNRSDFITKLLKDDEGQKERVRELLVGLEGALLPNITDARVRAGLEDIQKVRSYVGDRSASLKMLLEHLAISLPKV